MTRRVPAIVAVLVLVAAVAGCGDQPSGSERAFRTEAAGLCRDFSAGLLRQEVTPQTAERVLRASAARERRLFGDLADLDPPDRLASRFDRAVRAGRTDRSGAELVALGLRPCATFGLIVFEGGERLAAGASPICADAVRAIGKASRVPSAGGRRARAVATVLRGLSAGLAERPPPARARAMWRQGVDDLRTTADRIDAVARARSQEEAAPLDRALADSYAVGSVRWFLLNVEPCDKVLRAAADAGRSA